MAKGNKEPAFAENPEFFKKAFENAPDAFYMIDLKGNFIYANDAAERMIGYKRGYLIGKNFRNAGILSKESMGIAVSAMLKSIAGKPTGPDEYVLIRKDGSKMHVQIVTRPIRFGGKHVVMGTVRDITDRKKAEHEIKESEERFKELFDNMDECVAVYEVKDGGNEIIIKDFNKAAERLEKFLRKDIIGKRVDVAFKGVKELGLFDAFKKVWKTGKPINHPVSFYKDEYHSGWRENFIFKLPSGEVVAIYSDVTESKKAEETLKESEEKYRSIVDNIGIGVAMIDGNMKIMSLNTQMSKWFPKADVSVKPFCYKCFNDPPRKEICTWCPTCKTLQDGQVHESVTNTPSGSAVRHFRIVSSPIKENGKITAAIEMVEDITDKLNADEDIRKRNEELEKLNRLAVGRELRMVELKKRIKEMEGKSKARPEKGRDDNVSK